MHRIKIAFLIDTIATNTAGTERQLLEIIRRLDKGLFDPYLVCLRSSRWLETNELPCKIFVLNYHGFIKVSFVAVIKRFLRLLRRKGFDILQTFFEDSIFVGCLGALLSPVAPVLLSCRRDIGLGKDELWYHAIYKAVLPIFSRRFHGVVVNAHCIKKYVTRNQKVPFEKITVIYNGVIVPDHPEPTPQIFKDVRADVWIGIAANLKPVKRIDVFLKALNHLKDICRGIDIHGMILGGGPEKDRLHKIACDYDLLSTVHFVGVVNNVIPYLQNIDIGVLCSDREGLPNSILEYMVCKLPVVTTAVGGAPELVDHTNGFCVPPDDPVSLANALASLARSPALRKNMGERSIEKVRHSFLWNKIIAQWENYYRSLLINENG